MTRARTSFFLLAAGLLGAVLAWGLVGMPDFGVSPGAYAHYLTTHARGQRHVSNLVGAVVFDYRGWDTVGEELILFAAATGTAILLRSTRDERSHRPGDAVHSELLRASGRLGVPAVLLLGLWTISYGYVTPGGGFQGGVVAAGAALAVWLLGGYHQYREVTPTFLLDATEGSAISAFLGTGLVGLVGGATYLANTFAGGAAGSLVSAGSIAVLNAATGVAVATACVLIFHELLEERAHVLVGAVSEDEG